MPRISVNVSDTTRAALLEACEKSGRSMTAEVEARLRYALDIKASDCLLLLRLDDGLWAWLKAYAAGCSLWGSLEETVLQNMIRSTIIDAHKRDRCLELMYPHLPQRIRD